MLLEMIQLARRMVIEDEVDREDKNHEIEEKKANEIQKNLGDD